MLCVVLRPHGCRVKALSDGTTRPGGGSRALEVVGGLLGEGRTHGGATPPERARKLSSLLGAAFFEGLHRRGLIREKGEVNLVAYIDPADLRGLWRLREFGAVFCEQNTVKLNLAPAFLIGF